MRIALDAMGADTAPFPEIEGALAALRENKGIEIVLVGKKEVIEKELAQHDTTGLKLSVHHAGEVIEMSDSPSKALKTKRDSSIVHCIGLQKMKKVDASISAGNTGAFMGAALFGLGRLERVLRPAIAISIPTVNGYSLMLDMGANSDCRPQHPFQFARMGEIYVENVWGIKNPRVGLLSVGEESSKGNEAVVAAHAMLRESSMNFTGNIEGGDIILGKVDVLICDGFVGNVFLKFYESIPGFLTNTLGDLLIGERAEKFLLKFNKETYGGADLLGVDGVVVICHGSSSATAIKNAVLKAEKMVNNKVNDIIKTVMQGDPQLFE
ncbi:MAG: phosphate acyltransferase PlsX [Fibrobacterota bacterium]